MKQTRLRLLIALPFVFVALIIGLAAWYVTGHYVPVMQPRGEVGASEHRLIILGLLMSAIVVVPVFVMTVVISWRYREGNTKHKQYRPDWDGSKLYESIWWGIPILIIGVLCVVTWITSHQLDPYRTLNPTAQQQKVQVVALDWKWLFIYPDKHIASVNELVIPTDQTISFDITSDTVMNSFWIPALGSQIYAMPGMSTALHLNATEPGTYYGSPANISGSGFSSMTFKVRAVSPNEYDAWVLATQNTNRNLTTAAYDALAKPSKNNKVEYFSPVQDGLYDTLVMKYMMPANQSHTPSKDTKDTPAKTDDNMDMNMDMHTSMEMDMTR